MGVVRRLVLLLLLLLLSTPFGSSGVRLISVIEDHYRWEYHSWNDGTNSGFYWTVFSANGKKMGFLVGSCVHASNPYLDCSWTTFLAGGSISVSGVYNKACDGLTGKTCDIPIVGGTGIYTGARGFLRFGRISNNPKYKEAYLDTFHLL